MAVLHKKTTTKKQSLENPKYERFYGSIAQKKKTESLENPKYEAFYNYVYLQY